VARGKGVSCQKGGRGTFIKELLVGEMKFLWKGPSVLLEAQEQCNSFLRRRGNAGKRHKAHEENECKEIKKWPEKAEEKTVCPGKKVSELGAPKKL